MKMITENFGAIELAKINPAKANQSQDHKQGLGQEHKLASVNQGQKHKQDSK